MESNRDSRGRKIALLPPIFFAGKMTFRKRQIFQNRSLGFSASSSYFAKKIIHPLKQTKLF